MPIAFPPESRGPDWDWPEAITQRLVDDELQVDITNLGAVGGAFGTDSLDPGLGNDFGVNRGVNLRSLGNDYTDSVWDYRPNPATQMLTGVADNGVWVLQTDWAQSNTAIIGVTRDSGAAPLAACAVDLYASGSDLVVARTVSGGSGNYSFGNPGTGPFYVVAYLVGAPDKAGTTANTLMPVAV